MRDMLRKLGWIFVIGMSNCVIILFFVYVFMLFTARSEARLIIENCEQSDLYIVDSNGNLLRSYICDQEELIE